MTPEHLLLIDDEPDIREIAALSLERVGGFRLTTAVDGPSGVEAARRERPDLILMDVMMPGVSGPEVLAQLRADPELSAIPVVFMTAKVQESEVQSYLAAGALGVITKPFDPMSLPDEVRRLAAGLE